MNLLCKLFGHKWVNSKCTRWCDGQLWREEIWVDGKLLTNDEVNKLHKFYMKKKK